MAAVGKVSMELHSVLQKSTQSNGPTKVTSDADHEMKATDDRVDSNLVELRPDDKLAKFETEVEQLSMQLRKATNPPGGFSDPKGMLERTTRNAGLVQRETLREILEVNASVEYLQRHGLDGRTDVESFKKGLPVISYDDIATDILRLVNGEATHIFCADPISNFSLSSGTTAGKSKFIPTTARALDKFMFTIQGLLLSLYRESGIWKEGKELSLNFAGKLIDTPSGIKAGAFTSNLFRSGKYRQGDRRKLEVSPDEVVLCDDTNQGMYCHLLCGLSQALEIVKLQGLFAATVVAALRFLQNCWPQICHDIRTGTLNTKITDPAVRNAVGQILKPNPELASMIERECSLDNWEGIIPRLWKNVSYVSCVLSGTMQQYVPALKHFAGKIPLISPIYASCECNLVGVNIDPTCPPEAISYLIWPESAYFEFIPLNQDTNSYGPSTTESREEPPQTVDLVDVVLGQEYELVVTNFSGLYRYKLGDVLRVKGFKNTAPIFEFVCRKNVILSINCDKTDEEELQMVVTKATEHLTRTTMELADFSSQADMTSLPGHYVVFWEMVSSRDLDCTVLQECADILDASLNYEYRRARAGNLIDPLELRIVEEGTFQKMMAWAVSRGAAPSQYKPPRCVNSPQVAEILDAAVIATFHSLEKPSALPPSAPYEALK